LREERPERLIFPRLDVARRPVVEQAKTGDVVARLANRDRRAKVIAAADPQAELEFVVETAAWTELRRLRFRRLALAIGADDRLARRPHRARPAVVADRHIFVVGEQRA